MLNKIRFRSLFGNAWVVLFVAVSIAGVLTFFVYHYLADREARLRAEMSSKQTRAGVAVVVPNRDVAAGTPLSSSDFVSRDIAPDLVYDDMIRVADFDAYRASKLVRPVLHGRPLRTADIDALRGHDFSDIVPAGQRALTLEIDTVNSTASMLRPGNRVDVYWVGTSLDPAAGAFRQPDERRIIRLLMPNVLILATGQDVRPRSADDAPLGADGGGRANGNYGTVTVQIPATDAARLVLAQRVGTLRLILRNSDDKQTGLPVKLAESDLFPSTTTPRDASFVEVITGGSTSGSTTLVPGSVADERAQPGAAHPPRSPVADASTASAPAAPTSLYDTANAIARQLQQHGSRNAPDSN
ncbi:MAG TPA: Flp pilus assembly protein CpaB [Candidatus Limnocylindria bacterium]|nr:Flp pilus assembly protein CpaB [Candidatus Limnocylindria bacterium]